MVIPTYNRANEIIRTVNSVLNQSENSWDLIIVDDGSRDNTGEVIWELTKKDPRIQYLQRPAARPKGANACRNIGLEKARGKFVAFLDSDDTWSPDKLQKDRSFLQDHENAKGIHSGVWIDNGQSKYKAPARDIKTDESWVDYIFSADVMPVTSSFVVEKKAGIEVKFDESLQRHQDRDFFIRFGQQFDWSFREDFDCTLHWESDEIRNHHFPSMISYFEKYSPEISIPTNLGRYLVWAWVTARRYDSNFTTYYRNQLKKHFSTLPFRYKLFSWFPELFFGVWSLFKYLRSR